MMADAAGEPEQLREWIGRRLGLRFDADKLGFIADVLARRTRLAALTVPRYLDRLESAVGADERRALIAELTVPETYFFRHYDQFRAFAEVALPAACAAHGSARALQVLSVGCASGEEPYSLAMTVRDRAADLGGTVDIRAVDIHAGMLAKAAKGIYTSWSLRETPPDLQSRWFRPLGKDFQLDPRIRADVWFQEVNLADENAALWAPHTYDVIFCRNVLMYFTAEHLQALVDRLTRALTPGGHLFLGHAETLRGLSDAFHLRHTHDAFYYQRKDAAACADIFRAGPQPASWPDVIGHSSARIEALTTRPSTGTVAAPGAETAGQVARAMQLLKTERFVEALAALDGLPADAGEDRDVPLLRAALLTHSGQLDAAERASLAILERDELNTGAHYLLALCRESATDLQGAIEHDLAAAHLDGEFAMPRLHLGLMARRSGDRDGARRELARALPLLEREDASRLLLFGGGFARDSLIALCHAEWVSAGGVP